MGGGYVPDSGRPPGGQFPSYSFSSLVPVRHWARDPALRSWPVLLLVALVCVPPIALVLLNNPTEARIHLIAWIFAAYFAVAWLLLLGVIVRPQHVHRAMLAAVAVIGIVTQAPIAIFLETELQQHRQPARRLHHRRPRGTGQGHPDRGGGVDLAAVLAHPDAQGLPVPRRGERAGVRRGRGRALLHQRARLALGNVNGLDLQDLTIQYIWRFLTDPIDHAMWAGITGYFIGLAITGQDRRYSVGLVGIGIAAVLHGLNDWNPINSHPAWVLVTLISVLLFLGYARAGAWLPQQALASSPDLAPAAPGPPGRCRPAPRSGRGPGRPRARRPPAGPASYGARGQGPADGGHGPPPSREAWWQPPPAASAARPQLRGRPTPRRPPDTRRRARRRARPRRRPARCRQPPPAHHGPAQAAP